MQLVQHLDQEWVFRDKDTPFEAVEEADLAVDLWHSGEMMRAEEKFLSVIEENPSHIDAIHHYSLFLESTGRGVEAYLACRAAVSIGLHAIPKEFSWEFSKISWGSLDNRPFMRAYHNLGLYSLRQGRLGEAEKIFSNLLAANPNDNLGVRYMLPKIWFISARPELVEALCNKYDEPAPEISYSLALSLCLQGKISSAKQAMETASLDMPLVRKELLKKRHPKPKHVQEGFIMHGGQDQAYTYWQEYGEFWSASPSAMELLLSSGK